MKLNVYVMKDNKVGFMQPTFDQTDAIAIRNFKYAITNNDFLNVNSSDFDLYKIGIYDSDSGIIDALSTPEFICSGFVPTEV